MKTHGMFGTPIYGSWSAMLYRCRNPNAQAFPNYGGRGIMVCDRWHAFENFYADMGSTHWEGAEIDRKDVNGNYEPNNCRWATSKENIRNKRNTWYVVYRGEPHKLVELCERLGVSRRNVEARLYKDWSLEAALHTPVASKGLCRVELGGTSFKVRELAENFGLTYNALRGRLARGWTVERALGLTGEGVTT